MDNESIINMNSLIKSGLLNQSNYMYFDQKNGFGEHKPLAIELLKKTVSILDEFNINYFLISGTLLGYVRHNDFIPWDDDIDLIVDKTILEKLPLIYSKYKSDLIFINRENFLIKLCSRKGIEVNNKHINRYVINPYDKYKWPFIDLFIYDYNSPELQSKPQIQHQTNIIKFFDKKWLANYFFPCKTVDFLGCHVKIPNNPDYFLRINFGNDYMTTLKSNKYNHRQEIPNGKVKEIKK